MPVHVPGSRLYRSVPFKFLVKSTSGHGRASNIALNLTPFVDMMTILVTFLLMVFSSTGELLQAQPNLDLPLADSKGQLQQAPIIIVSKSDISFEGQQVTTIERVMLDDSAGVIITELSEKLEARATAIKSFIDGGGSGSAEVSEACEKAKRGVRPAEGQAVCPVGLAILQADSGTDARVINRIVNTSKRAGFDNIFFAIKKTN